MVKSQLIALVDSVLVNSRPSKAFSTTLVAAVTALGATSVKAAGVGIAGTSALSRTGTDYRLPTTDYRLPTTDYRYRLPKLID